MEWISVLDQLPITEGDLIKSNRHYLQEQVLAFKGQVVFECGYCVGNVTPFWGKFMDDGEQHITHWMPLPTPPEDSL